jgi:hypothetical protein
MWLDTLVDHSGSPDFFSQLTDYPEDISGFTQYFQENADICQDYIRKPP